MNDFSDVLAERGLPASVHTEIVVLGALLLDAVALNDATEKLRPEDFSLDSHRRVYQAVLDLTHVGHAVDLITVRDALEKKRELDAIGGAAYLAYLTEGVPYEPKVEEYVRIVKDKSLLRQVMLICQTAMGRAADQSEDALDVLNATEQQLMEVSEKGIQRGLSGYEQIFAEHFSSSPDALFSYAQGNQGVPTGFADLDRMTGGLQRSELIIIAARPSMGKTAWALNIAHNAAIRQRKVVAVFSLEMNDQDVLLRALGSEARINTKKMRSGNLTKPEKCRTIDALDSLMTSRIAIDKTPAITLAELRAKARRYKQQHGDLDLIVIDYLQLMTGVAGPGKRGFENRNQEVSAISRGLKALAKELDVPVVALSQLSRASEQRGGNKRPLLSDLRESGSIEQDADVVCFIHRDSYYNKTEDGEEDPETKGKAEIIIAKQRNGPTGSITLAYNAEFTRFDNLDTVHA